MTTTLKLKRLEHGVGLPVPAYATKGAACMDIHAAVSKTIAGRCADAVATGFAVEVPEGYELQVRSRSGLAANHGVHVLNSPGTIDSDYRGEIFVILHNTTSKPFNLMRGERVAQITLKPVEQVYVVEVEELTETKRGNGGLGSTGR